MNEKQYPTEYGVIHYWTNMIDQSRKTIVFLPGLTADHRLFEKQIAYFQTDYNVLVWDAPGHAESYPFQLKFHLSDKARWLYEILKQERIRQVIIVGQSMGGYVGQMFAELYPDMLSGFVSIDSAPLQRKYVTKAELWLLKKMEPVYRYYPWRWLLKSGVNGVSTSEYGRQLMKDMMLVYQGNQKRYAALSGHGMRMLAEAMEDNLAYQLPKNSLLICGTKDHAGSCLRYNKAWHKDTGIPLVLIEGAGHNANTDQPEAVNQLILQIVQASIARC